MRLVPSRRGAGGGGDKYSRYRTYGLAYRTATAVFAARGGDNSRYNDELMGHHSVVLRAAT